MKRRSFLALLGAIGSAPALAALDTVLPPAPAVEVPAGWCMLAGGLVLQWGTAGADGRVVFPMTFLATPINMLASLDGGAASVRRMAATGALVVPGADWLAIGLAP